MWPDRLGHQPCPRPRRPHCPRPAPHPRQVRQRLAVQLDPHCWAASRGCCRSYADLGVLGASAQGGLLVPCGNSKAGPPLGVAQLLNTCSSCPVQRSGTVPFGVRRLGLGLSAWKGQELGGRCRHSKVRSGPIPCKGLHADDPVPSGTGHM